MSLPLVAIVGRPNVGKSSLFNRILRKRLAVVDPTSGVTRDRHYSLCDWIGRDFRLVDTGGMVPDSIDKMEQAIFEQSDLAIEEADVILLVVDVGTGADTIDITLARKLLKSGRPTILVVNKVDMDSQENDVFEFMKLGLGDPFPISAMVGRGIAEVLDKAVELLPQVPDYVPEEGVIRVALIGRPNVGKSSFINKLMGEERHIVSPIAGTTRDATDSSYQIGDRKYTLVDTAGLRRKYKVKENIEFYTYLRTTRAIDNCDVAVLLIDGAESVTTQDQKILTQIMESRRAAVLAINKWDLVEKDSKTVDKFSLDIKDAIAKYAYLPMIFCSALSGQRVAKVMSFVDKVHAENNKRISTSELNEFLKVAYSKKKPPARKNKHIKFNYVTQSETAPPTFIFFCNHPTLVDKAYLSYLTNQLRAEYGFVGVPIRVKCRKK